MAWIKVPDWSRGSEYMRGLNDRFRGKEAEMDRILSIHGLHPEGLEAHYGLYKEVMFSRGPLSRRDRELVATAVSAANDCHY